MFGPWRPTDLNTTVAEYWINNTWDFSSLAYVLPLDVQEVLSFISLEPFTGLVAFDQMVWKGSASGCFNSSSALCFLLDINLKDNSFLGFGSSLSIPNQIFNLALG